MSWIFAGLITFIFVVNVTIALRIAPEIESVVRGNKTMLAKHRRITHYMIIFNITIIGTIIILNHKH